nr:sulfurtransferase TusA family protein [Phytoactinopolyspora limicola]
MSDAPHLVLDCRGMRCPLPVIQLAKRIGDVPVGGVVQVIADDPAAASDIPAWCRMRHHHYVGQEAVPVADGDSAGPAGPAVGTNDASRPGRALWPAYLVRRMQ